MKGNTFAVSFLLRKDKLNNLDEYPIYARVIVNTQRVHIATKRTIDPKFWDAKKYKVKKNHPSAEELNEYLFAVKNKIYSCYTELLQSNKPITAQRVKDLYNGNVQKAIDSLGQLSTLHLEELKGFMGNTITHNNFMKYRATHNYILEFIHSILKKKDIPLDEVNFSLLKQFEHFLHSAKKCHQNGSMKHMQRLKKVFNWAIKNEYLTTNPFRNYSITFKRYDRGYLTMEEIEAIQRLKGLTKKLQYAKDFFIFQLYTGLAYSDMIDLKAEDIVKGIDGEYWIHKNRVKTDTKLTIPLLPYAYEILQKYNHSGSVFPRISNQKINKNLKELGELAGIKQPLSTHLARHSAATTIWLQNGVSIEVVSKMLGHTKISTTQIYGRVVEKKISEEIKVLKGKLGQN